MEELISSTISFPEILYLKISLTITFPTKNESSTLNLGFKN